MHRRNDKQNIMRKRKLYITMIEKCINSLKKLKGFPKNKIIN